MKIGIIGCGVVGAAIAYRLSKVPGIEVLAFDQRKPSQLDATGAALGVLMAVSSSKLKGRNVALRLDSLRLYETLIPELVQLTGIDIPYNRHGIVQLCFDVEEFQRWDAMQVARHKKGFDLALWSRSQVLEHFPELAQAYWGEPDAVAVGAVYSPQDRQVDPTVLTHALLEGARQQGSRIQFQTPVSVFQTTGVEPQRQVTHLGLPDESVAVDWLVVAAGLGSMPITQTLQQPISLGPVLGQALHVRCSVPWPTQMPVINGCDVHLVPVNAHEGWVGATVEYPLADDPDRVEPNPQDLERLREQAIALYPPLAEATILRTWQGFRPRPNERAAPIIAPLPGYTNVLLATGHYRNGILLAPITAEKIYRYLAQIERLPPDE
ncbi:MAG: FAD-dependent oxidoreductase [Thermosynechococcaceae cyanobacterium]